MGVIFPWKFESSPGHHKGFTIDAINMNPNETDLYGGLAGMKMPLGQYDFGHGIMLKQTYAHLMSPFLIAFPPAEKGQPHPAPLKVVNSGLSFDIFLELYIPQNFVPQWSNRLNTVWWFAALLRFEAGNHLIVPVISNVPFKDGGALQKAHFWSNEIDNRLLPERPATEEISEAHLGWIQRFWWSAAGLMKLSEEFAFLFLAFDQCCFQRNKPQALIMLWSALENIFSTSNRTELRFRISANIASYLEPPGNDRQQLHKKITKLYDMRSIAVHGIPKDVERAFLETHRITKEIIKKAQD